MAIVYQANKKTGITYAYENKAYWDPQKQQSRAKRKLIGKVDPESGEIVATRSYNKRQPPQELPAKRGPVPITQTKRSFFGATWLFDHIGKETGVEEDLKICFPKQYKQILSIAYYLILEESSVLSRFSHWERLHIHPYGADISSQQSSVLFQQITEEQRMQFFRRQGKRRIEKEYWAFDTTSISSYSETLAQVKKGKNKEGDRLPQINLALLFGEQSGLPFYYRKLPGNISDVTILKQLLRELQIFGYGKVNVVLDRGFYSQDNVNELYRNHQKFLLGTKLNLQYVKPILEEERENLHLWGHLLSQYGIYGVCRTISWDYEQKRPYKGDVLREGRRAYLLLYYNPEKAAQDGVHMNAHWSELYRDLQSGNRREYWAKEYDRYFTVTETPKRGRKIEPKEEAMREATRNYGYFALLSNEVQDPAEALALYRSKDIVEKAFGNLKDRLDARRLQVSSELSLNGKVFVEFIALIYLSYVKKKMQDAKLFEKWTLQGLLDELDTMELLQDPEHGRLLGEVTKKQKDIYVAMHVPEPSL